MKLAADFQFAFDPDGTVRIEVWSNHRDFWDEQRLARKTDLVRPPLRTFPDSDFDITHIGSRRHHGLPYIRVRVAGSGIWESQAGQAIRFLHFTVDGPDRRALQAIARQDEVRVIWKSDGVEAVYRLPPDRRRGFNEALDLVVSLTAAEMYEEKLQYGYPRAWLRAFSTRRPASRRRRTVTGPPPPIPFFAETTGAVPRDGRPTIAGYRLPPGQRSPDSGPTYWISDEPIPVAEVPLRDLAGEYPQTGVWPLLWTPSEDPQSYIQHAGDADLVDTVDVEGRLRHRWETYAPVNLAAVEPYDATFPGLAHGREAGTRTADHPADPFADLKATSARLMLVACNRPADAVALIGGLTAETSGTTISAVLRTWEERFAATLIAVGLREAWLSIQAPPEDIDQALHLAAEHWTFCPPEGAGQPGSLRAIASALVGDNPKTGVTAPDLTPTWWRIAWYD